MAPSPQYKDDSNNSGQDQEDPDEEIFMVDDEIILDEHDTAPGIEEEMEELDFDDNEENGYLPDDAIMAFQKHEGSVFCVAFHPTNKKFAMTGGEDDKAYVWNTETGDILFQCGEHKDSIVSCGFSFDGKYVMSADMSGVIIVHSVEDGKKVWDFECSEIEWAKWHQSAPVLFAGTSDGSIYMWKIPSGDCKICHGHGPKSCSGVLLPDGKQLFSGYDDGSFKMWDLKTSQPTFSIASEPDSEPIICVACSKSGHLLAAGTLDSTVKVINSASGKVVATLYDKPTSPDFDPQNEEEEGAFSIECVAFSPDQQFLAVGALHGSLTIWDISSQRIRHKCQHPRGISRIIWQESTPTHIITACLDGVIRCWDSGSGSVVKEWNGHREDILDLDISSDGLLLVSGSDDKSARIFNR